MKHYFFAVFAIISLSACSSNYDPEKDVSGIALDAVTTMAVLSKGGVESNPLLAKVAGGDPVTTAVVSTGLKLGLEAVLKPQVENNRKYAPDTVRRIDNTISIGAGCSNILVFASQVGLIGAAIQFGEPASLLAFAGCSVWKWNYDKKRSKYTRIPEAPYWVKK